jgi:hypothetical protein
VAGAGKPTASDQPGFERGRHEPFGLLEVPASLDFTVSGLVAAAS